MIGNKRNYSLSIWDHEDNFICLLKSANSEINGQSYNERLDENINGQKTLSFSIPMYIFDMNSGESQDHEKTSKTQYFKQNELWRHIYNEQKIRYVEYDEDTNEEIKVEEFILKNYSESRTGEEKIAECTCESLAVYELGKVGWGITFDVEYVTQYETERNSEDLLTLDYWLKKIFYKETNLGRVTNITECTYLLQGLQLRNEEGAPISKNYLIDKDGNYVYQVISEPIATSSDVEKYYNPTGWTWEVAAKDPRDPNKEVIGPDLYEEPTINKYVQRSANTYVGQSYQKAISQLDSQKKLRDHPIDKKDYSTLMYVTDIKKRLISIERSNIYNIIQELCESFKIFAYFQYNYGTDGKIKERKILFKTEAINDVINFDFSYGKNLLSCKRTLDSNDLVTKLYVPDIESPINNGNILSIKESICNPTGEGYLYNFKYFYDNGTLTKDKYNIQTDEYYINLHCGELKNYNVKITDIQNILVPLYNRRDKLEGDLLIQQSSKTAIMDNMQNIQEKIDAIDKEDQVIESWSQYEKQYNHVGELKTVSTTNINGEEKLYINFGRDDIIYDKSITYTPYTINANQEVILSPSTTTINSYIPRYYSSTTEYKPENATTTIDPDDIKVFTLLDTNKVTPIYSKIGEYDTKFINGLIFNENKYPNDKTYIRIRYKYAPLVWYYLLLKDYWEQLKEVNNSINILNSQLIEIKNKIVTNELKLKNILTEKNEKILQFENKYKAYIKEGYWEPSNYQGQLFPKLVDTRRNNTDVFTGLFSITTPLKELNLNDSIHNYRYYINLNIPATDVKLDSFFMTTSNKFVEESEVPNEYIDKYDYYVRMKPFINLNNYDNAFKYYTQELSNKRILDLEILGKLKNAVESSEIIKNNQYFIPSDHIFDFNIHSAEDLFNLDKEWAISYGLEWDYKYGLWYYPNSALWYSNGYLWDRNNNAYDVKTKKPLSDILSEDELTTLEGDKFIIRLSPNFVIKNQYAVYSEGNVGSIDIPRYRGNDFEVYINENNKVILGIAPSLIDTYELYKYNLKNYKSTVTYQTSNGVTTTVEYNWTEINNSNNPKSINRYIYITDDNIVFDSITIDGYFENNFIKRLEPSVDYEYIFDYVGYDDQGRIIDLNNQSSYESNVYYDYITKITLKNTDTTVQCNRFIVNYNEDTTLQYLYKDAEQTSNKYCEPQVSYDINVLDISSLHEYKDYKPQLGQKVPIYDKEMGLNGFEGFITSISRVLDTPQDTNITIATYSTKFEDVFQKLTATMSNIQYNENAIDRTISSFNDEGNAIKADVFQKSLEDNSFQISLGTDNDTIIDKKLGITLIDKINNNAVRLIGRGIFLTENYNGDSDSTWKTGITGEGINASALMTGNIDTKNINIWNATEGQVRFMWNEKGLFAYAPQGSSGTSTSTADEFVDYKKYVKFSHEGLQFSDNGKSALHLGWRGLLIQAQENSLELNADDGLIIQKEQNRRLHLGRLDANNDLYGLRLLSKNGQITFQNDSDGNLWLHKELSMGGSVTTTTINGNSSTIIDKPTAGIYGFGDGSESTEVDISHQMGYMKLPGKELEWNSNPIRFWAGIQTTTAYLETLKIEESSIVNKTNYDDFKKLKNAPTLAKFKVDSEGNIIASGHIIGESFDIGGWSAGEGELHSNNYQAILRSNDNNNNPIFSIGNPNGNTTSATTGEGYNFRVYKDGSLNIGNNNFTISSGGIVDAKGINITGGSIGGLSISTNYLEFNTTEEKNNKNYTYTVGLYSVTQGEDIALKIGTTKIGNEEKDASFIVQNNGTLKATNAIISGTVDALGGTIAGWLIGTNEISKTLSGYKTGIQVPNDNSDNYVFYSGADSNPKFYVTKTGTLNATNAIISGTVDASAGSIAGWKIDTNELGYHTPNAFRGGIFNPTAKSDIVFYAGTKGLSNNKPSTDNEFYVTAGGEVHATKLTISLDNTNVKTSEGDKTLSTIISAGNIEVVGGFTNTNNKVNDSNNPNGLRINYEDNNNNNNNYYVGLKAPTSKTDVVFYAGTSGANSTNNAFYVKADGTIKATRGEIGGWNISSSRLYTLSGTNITALYPNANNSNAVMFIGTQDQPNNSSNTYTKFKITGNGSVYFNENIYAKDSSGTFRNGLTKGNLTFINNKGDYIAVEISKGLIIDMTNV